MLELEVIYYFPHTHSKSIFIEFPGTDSHPPFTLEDYASINNSYNFLSIPKLTKY